MFCLNVMMSIIIIHLPAAKSNVKTIIKIAFQNGNCCYFKYNAAPKFNPKDTMLQQLTTTFPGFFCQLHSPISQKKQNSLYVKIFLHKLQNNIYKQYSILVINGFLSLRDFLFHLIAIL